MGRMLMKIRDDLKWPSESGTAGQVLVARRTETNNILITWEDDSVDLERMTKDEVLTWEYLKGMGTSYAASVVSGGTLTRSEEQRGLAEVHIRTKATYLYINGERYKRVKVPDSDSFIYNWDSEEGETND